jgi:metallo-beta-lactamase family protein
LVLPDAAHIQEEDARQANRHNYTRHAPALPLFTSADAARALTHLQPVGYNRPVPIWGSDQGRTGVSPGSDPTAEIATVEFINAGHLLGSAYARVRVGDRTILFGGDLGRYGRPILPDPSPVDEADVLLLESTYGDRVHEADDNGDRLAAIVNDTAARGGRLIIPSFAIGRVEEIVYWLKRLEDEKRIPVLPVYIDSPMAVAALKFHAGRMNELDPELTPGLRHVAAFQTARMTTVSSPQQSKDLTASRQPAIVISSSGMATGGRVLHHLEAAITSAKNTVLFVGYQAAGTRGRTLVDGGTELKLHGRILPVAARIERIDSMSAHADAAEIMRWLSGFSRPPRMTHLVHGEPGALQALAARITAERGWPVHIAAYQERVTLP